MFVLRVNGSLSARYKRRLSVHTSSVVVNTPVSTQAERCTAPTGACLCITPCREVRHVELCMGVSLSESRIVCSRLTFYRYDSRAVLSYRSTTCSVLNKTDPASSTARCSVSSVPSALASTAVTASPYRSGLLVERLEGKLPPGDPTSRVVMLRMSSDIPQ